MACQRSHLGNVSARDRVKLSKTELYEDSGKLFCRICQKGVDHRRKSTVDSHLTSAKHVAKKRKWEQLQASDVRPIAVRQTTVPAALKAATTAKECRDEVALDFISALIGAGIPFHKADNPEVRTFIDKHVRNGGSIAGSRQLWNKVPTLFERHRETLKAAVQGKKLSIVLDETTDDRANMVLNILFVLPVLSSTENLVPLLVDVVFMDKCDAANVGGNILKCLTAYDVEFKDVLSLMTDNAGYMKKVFRKYVGPLCPNAVQVTCLAHTINLVGEELRKNYALLDTFVAKMKRAFRLSAIKKLYYVDFLKSKGVLNPKTPPAPVVTRWGTWLEAVIQHEEYMEHYPEMLEEMLAKFGGGGAVDELHSMTQENEKEISIHLKFTAVFGKKIIDAIKQAESQETAVHTAYNTMSDLASYLKAASVKDYSKLLKEGKYASSKMEAKRLNASIQDGMEAASTKAYKYRDGTGCGWPFLKAIRCLDPNQLHTLPGDKCNFSAVPLLSEVSGEEWDIYKSVASELAAFEM